MNQNSFEALLGHGISGPYVDRTAPRMDINDMTETIEDDITIGQFNAMAMLAYAQLATMFDDPSLIEGPPAAFIALLKRSHGGSLDDLQEGLREFLITMLPDAGLPTHVASAISGITMVLGEMEAFYARRVKIIADEREAKRVQDEAEAQCAQEGHTELQQAWRMDSQGSGRVLVMACLRCGYDEPVEPQP